MLKLYVRGNRSPGKQRLQFFSSIQTVLQCCFVSDKSRLIVNIAIIALGRGIYYQAELHTPMT